MIAGSYFRLFTSFVKRDFKFAALFLWMIPFAASLSRSFVAFFRSSAALALSVEVRICLTAVRMRDRECPFRVALRASTRARFSADLCCAIQPSLSSLMVKRKSGHIIYRYCC